jgi:hypothetical protein
MRESLVGGLAAFSCCWLIHWVVWRVRRPSAYLTYLPAIFWLLPALTALGVLGGTGRLSLLLHPAGEGFPWVAAALLHGSLSLCYLCGYAGVVEYSPSAEILLAVRQQMPAGVSPRELRVVSLTDYALTGKRVEHLLAARLIAQKEGHLSLTPRGAAVLSLCGLYRRLLAVPGEGAG